MLGRLKPGVTEAQAEADLRPIVADLAQREPAQFPEGWRVGLLVVQGDVPEQPGRDAVDPVCRRRAAAAHRLRERLEPPAVARGDPAARDGAARRDRRGRGRLVRQLLTESLLIAVGGALLGIPLAYARPQRHHRAGAARTPSPTNRRS